MCIGLLNPLSFTYHYWNCLAILYDTSIKSTIGGLQVQGLIFVSAFNIPQNTLTQTHTLISFLPVVQD